MGLSTQFFGASMNADFDYSGVMSRLLSLKRNDETEGDFARRLGVSPNTFTNYKKGQNSFGLHEVTKICDETEADPHWLLFGVPASGVAEVSTLIEKGWIDSERINLPLFDAALSAGNGLVAIDEMPSGQISLHEQFLYKIGGSPQHCYVVQAHGDSMWPTIPDASYLIVDGSKTEVVDGVIYHFNVNERSVVKRARWRMDGKLHLTSDNGAAGYQEESFSLDRADDLSVGGRVMYVMHAPLPVLR